MPRISGTYSVPPGTEGFTDTTIESEKYNNYIHDVEKDLNDPRPISAGGTGANNADAAVANLGAEKSSQQVSNYNSHVFYPGSFYSTSAAGQAAPIDGHAFVGIAVSSDPPANPPANKNVVIRAYDQSSTVVPGRIYVREKKVDATHSNGLWGPWSIDGTGVAGPTPPTDPPDGLLWFDSEGGHLYVYYNDGNSKQWVIASPFSDPAQFLLKAGDTMVGQLSLTLPPTTALHAVNKAYVDSSTTGLASKVDKAGGTGSIMTGPLINGTKGSLFGTASGVAASGSVTQADANIKLYDNTGPNWAGIGTDPAGTMWFRVGTVAGLVPLVRFEGTPNYAVNIQGTLNVSSGMNLTGAANIGGALGVSGTINSTGRMTTGSEASGFFANNSNFFGFCGDGSTRQFYFSPVATFTFNVGDAALYWGNGGATNTFWRASDNTFHASNGNAGKPGGGFWYDDSDIRIKTVDGEYTRGLDAVCALRPISYSFKGNETYGPPANVSKQGEDPLPPPTTAPFPNSPHYHVAVDKTKFVGLVAQEVETIFPEMVMKQTAQIDGQPVTDLRNLNLTPLTFALINAIKELKARIEVLEGG